MRILISNVYSYKNKGDAAIVLALVQEIKRVFHEPEIVIQTTDIKHDEGKYGQPVTSSLLWIMLSSVREKSIINRLFKIFTYGIGLIIYLTIYKIFHNAPKFLLANEMHTFVREYQSADLIIACGGGYLRSTSKKLIETLLLSVTCLNFVSAKYLNKPVYLYSQSIGPVHGKIQTSILKFSLNRVDIIEARENITYKYLNGLGLKSKIIKTADPALLLEGRKQLSKTTKINLNSKRIKVGVTVRKWFNNPDQFDRYITAVARNIDYMITKHNATVFYIPQVIAENFGDDDRLAAQKVKDKVKNKKYFVLIEDDLHPIEIIALCGNMDYFIGTRMHSNIFALINSVPVVAIEYEHKTKGIMHGLGLDDLTIDIQEVMYDTLQQKIDKLFKYRDKYIHLIKQNMPSQKKQSRVAIEKIKEAYEIENAT